MSLSYQTYQINYNTYKWEMIFLQQFYNIFITNHKWHDLGRFIIYIEKKRLEY